VTALARRRRRATQLAVGGTVLALFVAAGLTLVGVNTLADSRAGRRASESDERPVQRLPYTPTALVGTIDEEGRLTSVVVMAVEPDGTGGSIVELAASSDANSGNTGSLSPLHAVSKVQGPESFRFAAEGLTGLSFDVVELVDPERFAQIVSPLGDLPVNLPISLFDASTAESFAAGDSVMPGSLAARAVTAVDPSIDDWLYEPGRAAIWAAVADRVGAGIGTADEVASDADLPRPADLDQFLARLFAAQVQFRALSVRPIDAERVSTQLAPELAEAFGVGAAAGVSVHDRSELLMVMGAIAPGRVGAPLEAPSFRVTMGFTDADLEPYGLRGSDVLKQAIARLLFSQVNVVSVAELPGTEVPDQSTFVVADASTVEGVRAGYTGAFGDIEVLVAQALIEGVDIELVLGRDFLDLMGSISAPEVTGSGVDDGTDEASNSTAGNETSDASD
jgi:hypothetical protein